ncbi:Zinc finger protein MAGPIE [Hordeum vulgare]|nr:Zinc finger protein MAGPIE [Hordeum vulgare]
MIIQKHHRRCRQHRHGWHGRTPRHAADPDTEVVSLSPPTLLELRKREAGKTAPLPQKRVLMCPEPSCPHHHPSRALSGASAVKLHFCSQHGAQRQWSCCRCSRPYAVRGDYKAHLNICGCDVQPGWGTKEEKVWTGVGVVKKIRQLTGTRVVRGR